MSVEQIPPRRKLRAAAVALEMSETGLPDDFVAAVLECAMHKEGFLDLVELWGEGDPGERDAVVADLHEHLEDSKAWAS